MSPDVEDDPDYERSVRGVARLESLYDNVISVGSLAAERDKSGDLVNAVEVGLDVTSNYGPNLTLLAPVEVFAVDENDEVAVYGGTSAANSTLAAIA